MTKPGDEPGAFSLTFRSDMDRMADDLYEYMDVLRVQGPSGRAVLFANRQGADQIHPIGLFGTALTKQQLDSLTGMLDAIPWNELPDPEGGDAYDAGLSIDYARGQRLVRRSFGPRGRGKFMRAVSPFIDLTGDLEIEIERHPLRALKLTFERTQKGFKLLLRNIGTGPLMIADPRLPGSAAGTTRGRISVAYGGGQNPDFKPLALEGAGKDHPPVILGPGQSHEVHSVAWAPSAVGKYYAEGTWEDYIGPKVDPKTVMPMLPEPEQMDDPRPYVLRGAAFSDNIEFTQR